MLDTATLWLGLRKSRITLELSLRVPGL
ncbi:hypothetical protein LINPERHAP2_LOCUS7426 [Linum perenne]